jgi:hypothetical protein
LRAWAYQQPIATGVRNAGTKPVCGDGAFRFCPGRLPVIQVSREANLALNSGNPARDSSLQIRVDREGVDLRSKYPKGSDPIVLGESVNTLTTYGYDPATGMQEPKATLCQIRAA